MRWECQGSGKCCVSRGQYGYVYVTKADRRRFAKHFGISTTEFTKKYCEKDEGLFHLKEDPSKGECQFLVDNQCSVYEARPTQCRTWPFWPELMNAKSWNSEVKNFCPGVGKGRVWSASEIQNQLDIQSSADQQV